MIFRKFDYACIALYPDFTKYLKTKLETLQSKCICFSLQLDYS